MGHTSRAESIARHLPEGFTIERELGAGGTASVYLAHRPADGERLVVKVLHPRVLAGAGAERFLREIEILRRLEHPRIVPIGAPGEADGLLFFTMPFAGEETLRARIASGVAFGAREVLRIARDLSDALGHAHGRGVVHRDLKPENILLAPDGARLMDFGFASAPSLMSHEALEGEASLVIGTLLYLAPEQMTGRHAGDWRGDFFSLGCVMYEMLTGRPPWVARTSREMERVRRANPEPDVRAARPDVPADIVGILHCLLAPHPNDRYATAAFLSGALDAALAHLDQPAA